MRPKDVAPCVALVASHPEERRRYGTVLEQLRPAWVKLIRSGAMQPILIEDTGGHTPRVAGCGASLFVSDQLLGCLKADPMVWLGPELVRRALLEDGSILPPNAIREANSRQGSLGRSRAPHAAGVLLGADACLRLPTYRSHFVAIAAQHPRQIPVDLRAKRGAGRTMISLDDAQAATAPRPVDLLALDEAVERLLGVDFRKACAIELKFFGGLELAEIAAVLNISLKTVEKDVRLGVAWLRSALNAQPTA